MTEPPTLALLRLGRTAYGEALARQRAVHEQRKAGLCPDTLILTDHEPVLTLGRHADARHLRVPEAVLAARGIALVAVERGGDITYHGPGQLVAYPILDLSSYGRDIRRYIGALEQSVITLLTSYGIASERRPGTPGVWVGAEKIASVGVFISRWVTLHGLAINIDPDLAPFDLIEPCGLVGTRMTSLARLLGRPVALADAAERFIPLFRASLGNLAAAGAGTRVSDEIR